MPLYRRIDKLTVLEIFALMLQLFLLGINVVEKVSIWLRVMIYVHKISEPITSNFLKAEFHKFYLAHLTRSFPMHPSSTP